MMSVVMSNVAPKFENTVAAAQARDKPISLPDLEALFLTAELRLILLLRPTLVFQSLSPPATPLPLVAAPLLIMAVIAALAVYTVDLVIIYMMGLATMVVVIIVAIAVLVVSAIVVVVVLSKMAFNSVDPTMLLGFLAQPHLMVPPDLAARFAILLAMVLCSTPQFGL